MSGFTLWGFDGSTYVRTIKMQGLSHRNPGALIKGD